MEAAQRRRAGGSTRLPGDGLAQLQRAILPLDLLVDMTPPLLRVFRSPPSVGDRQSRRTAVGRPAVRKQRWRPSRESRPADGGGRYCDAAAAAATAASSTPARAGWARAGATRDSNSATGSHSGRRARAARTVPALCVHYIMVTSK